MPRSTSVFLSLRKYTTNHVRKKNILNELSRFQHLTCQYIKQWLIVTIFRHSLTNTMSLERNDERKNDNKTLVGLLVFQHMVLA